MKNEKKMAKKTSAASARMLVDKLLWSNAKLKIGNLSWSTLYVASSINGPFYKVV